MVVKNVFGITANMDYSWNTGKLAAWAGLAFLCNVPATTALHLLIRNNDRYIYRPFA